MAEVYIIKY